MLVVRGSPTLPFKPPRTLTRTGVPSGTAAEICWVLRTEIPMPRESAVPGNTETRPVISAFNADVLRPAKPEKRLLGVPMGSRVEMMSQLKESHSGSSLALTKPDHWMRRGGVAGWTWKWLVWEAEAGEGAREKNNAAKRILMLGARKT